MGYENPDVDSDNDDDNIFKSEESFYDDFNTFVNKGVQKRDKNVLSLFSGFLLFLKYWKLTHIKNLILTQPRN